MSNDEGLSKPPGVSRPRGAWSLIRRSSFELRHSKSGAISWPVAITVIVALITAVVVFIFWRIESWPARSARQGSAELEKLGRDLRAAFIDIAHLQPQIKINDRVYMEQTTPTSELVVVSKRIEVEHELQHTWAGSSKRVKLHGTFLVKAGFDLRQDLSVDVRPDSILIRMPHAQILGVEQQNVELLEFENGYWNRISATDVQGELDMLPQLARRKASESGLTAEAEQSLEQQLHARVKVAQPVQVTFGGAAPQD